VAWHEYVGSIHFHTLHSDGHRNVAEIVALANPAGLDFLIATDHNILPEGEEGWRGRVLVLMGEEIHDEERRPEMDHYLALGISQDVASHRKSPQAVIQAVRAQGGLGFLAHPFERTSPASSEPPIPWESWEAEGYTGLEIWNYMSEFKSHLTSFPKALFLCYFPEAEIKGPFPETLAKWDELLAGREVPAIAGTDAHGGIYLWGPLRREVLPYAFLLRTLRMHILTPEPFIGELAHDRALVYRALGEGNGFIAYDLLGDTRGFRFLARSERAEAIMGQNLVLEGPVEFQVSSPLGAHLRLLRAGEVVAEAKGRSLNYRTEEPGVYRLEARRRYLGLERGWVFTNPIYARSA